MSDSVREDTERWIRIGSKRIPLGVRPLVMGVLNVTPDSFSDGGRFVSPQNALDQIQHMIDAGADMIDVGAESSKPGSIGISVEEELRRLQPVLEGFGKHCQVPLSIDTKKAVVAKRALEWGVDIINDISALQFDSDMGYVVAEAQAGVVLMHMQGDPATMQKSCHYDNVVADVKKFLKDRIDVAESYGIRREQILLDPGIGFGKTTEHNLRLMNGLDAFESLGQPILVGVSNKSFIGTVLNRPVTERIMGTAAAVATAVLRGANIIRVHEVEQMRDVVMMTTAIKQADWN